MRERKTGQVAGGLFKAAQSRAVQGKAGRSGMFLFVLLVLPLCAVECGHVMAVIVLKHIVSLVVGQKAVALPMWNMTDFCLDWDGLGARQPEISLEFLSGDYGAVRYGMWDVCAFLYALMPRRLSDGYNYLLGMLLLLLYE